MVKVPVVVLQTSPNISLQNRAIISKRKKKQQLFNPGRVGDAGEGGVIKVDPSAAKKQASFRTKLGLRKLSRWR